MPVILRIKKLIKKNFKNSNQKIDSDDKKLFFFAFKHIIMRICTQQ